MPRDHRMDTVGFTVHLRLAWGLELVALEGGFNVVAVIEPNTTPRRYPPTHKADSGLPLVKPFWFCFGLGVVFLGSMIYTWEAGQVIVRHSF